MNWNINLSFIALWITSSASDDFFLWLHVDTLWIWFTYVLKFSHFPFQTSGCSGYQVPWQIRGRQEEKTNNNSHILNMIFTECIISKSRWKSQIYFNCTLMMLQCSGEKKCVYSLINKKWRKRGWIIQSIIDLYINDDSDKFQSFWTSQKIISNEEL